MSLPPLRFYSIVLAVADLPTVRDWYARVLGLAEAFSGASETDGTAFCIMEGAGTRVELVSRPGITQVPALWPEPPAHLDEAGWTTLDLECDDLAALDAHLKVQNVERAEPLRILSPRRAMLTIRDPEGNLIAFFGPPF